MTLDELEPEAWLSDPLIINVIKIEKSEERKRNAVVYFEDINGNKSYLTDWQIIDLGTDWKPGQMYVLSDIGVKKGRNGYRVYLDPTSRTEVLKIERTDPTRLVVMGDSHVGRRRHPRETREIDCAGQFRKAIQEAVELEADAVVHTGDVFHDAVPEADLQVVDESIEILRKNQMSFYYIRGNHECRAGNELLECHQNRDVVTHLAPDGLNIGDGVILHGIDYHSPDTFPVESVRDFDRTAEHHILVLHQTLSSLRGGKGTDIPKSVLEKYDHVLAGDLHDAEQHDLQTGGILYTGSTEWLSRKPSSSVPSVWLLTPSNTIVPERHPIG